MARDPKRIRRVLRRIREVWEQYPDLRLMQLLLNVVDPLWAYHLDDDVLLDLLLRTYADVPKKKTQVRGKRGRRS